MLYDPSLENGMRRFRIAHLLTKSQRFPRRKLRLVNIKIEFLHPCFHLFSFDGVVVVPIYRYLPTVLKSDPLSAVSHIKSTRDVQIHFPLVSHCNKDPGSESLVSIVSLSSKEQEQQQQQQQHQNKESGLPL
jgi:hypothetical protein